MNTSEINKLKRNIALKTALKIILISILAMGITLFFIDGIFNDKLVDLIISFDGILWYRLMKYKAIVLVIIYSIIVLVVAYFVIKRTNSYFGEIVDCIKLILKNSDEDIHLSSDLSLLENDLNKIRIDLIQSKAKALEEENKKNDLIMYMAHDLKTPLTSVIGYLSLLSDEVGLNKKQRDKYIKIALEKAYRVEELTNEFFEITRYNLHEMITSKSKIDLSLLLDQLIDESYPMLQEKELTIKAHKKANIPYMGDGTLLARAFSNIIKNAINYSYAKSEINISINSDKEKIVISFKNKGDKIPSYKLEKLFEKFYRVDESRTTKTGGSGLGLSITKEIIELHNGKIAVNNDDEYIEFLIELPNK